MFKHRLPDELVVYDGRRRLVIWGQTAAGNRPAEEYLDGIDITDYARLESLWKILADEVVFHHKAYVDMGDLRLREFKLRNGVRLLVRPHKHYVILVRGAAKQRRKLRPAELKAAERLGDQMVKWLTELEANA